MTRAAHRSGAIRSRAPDPAPSRWRYRLQRLWLRPAVRAVVRWGLPLGAAALGAALWLGEPERRAAFAGLGADAVAAVRDRPEFAVTALRIDGAGPELRAAIERAVPVALPASQFALDLEAMRAAVAALGPVAEAEVRLQAGGELVVTVRERAAALAWATEGEVLLLDAEGHRVAAVPDVAAAGALPLVAGAEADRHAAEALRLTEAAAPLADELVGLVRVGGRRWDVLLSEGRRILLPEAGAADALAAALALDAAHDLLARELRAIDLRLAGRPTLRLTEAAHATLRERRRSALALAREGDDR